MLVDMVSVFSFCKPKCEYMLYDSYFMTSFERPALPSIVDVKLPLGIDACLQSDLPLINILNHTTHTYNYTRSTRCDGDHHNRDTDKGATRRG